MTVQYQVTHHWKADFAGDFMVVTVAIVDLRLTSRQMGTDKAQRAALVQEANGHAPFVTCRSSKSCFS